MKKRQSKCLGCVKNLSTALENKGNCIAGSLARADLHTGVDLELHRTAKKKGTKKEKKKKRKNPTNVLYYHAC